MWLGSLASLLLGYAIQRRNPPPHPPSMAPSRLPDASAAPLAGAIQQPRAAVVPFPGPPPPPPPPPHPAATGDSAPHPSHPPQTAPSGPPGASAAPLAGAIQPPRAVVVPFPGPSTPASVAPPRCRGSWSPPLSTPPPALRRPISASPRHGATPDLRERGQDVVAVLPGPRASAFEGGDRQGEETIFFCALSLHNTVQAGAVRWTAAMNQGAASLLVTVRT
ncbi:hypothetical protein PVAP13_2KG379315 [Panicum virgatum]|uniref:Uncharacterized protein n=1 Tax=Panicum virgatum TaxID=38727 RepID=A0A8T0W645_PANVG|nr:hypothetical protein PVAP13_2KG379315 [Panicum virgatum]